MPPPDETAQVTTEDAEKTIGSLNKYIEEFNNQRNNFMNAIRPRKKNIQVGAENSKDTEDNSNESE